MIRFLYSFVEIHRYKVLAFISVFIYVREVPVEGGTTPAFREVIAVVAK